MITQKAGKLGLLLMPSAPRARLWSVTKAKGTAAGMAVRRNGDSEGTLLFVNQPRAGNACSETGEGKGGDERSPEATAGPLWVQKPPR